MLVLLLKFKFSMASWLKTGFCTIWKSLVPRSAREWLWSDQWSSCSIPCRLRQTSMLWNIAKDNVENIAWKGKKMVWCGNAVTALAPLSGLAREKPPEPETASQFSCPGQMENRSGIDTASVLRCCMWHLHAFTPTAATLKLNAIHGATRDVLRALPRGHGEDGDVGACGDPGNCRRRRYSWCSCQLLDDF